MSIQPTSSGPAAPTIETTDCVICYQEMRDQIDRITTLACSHKFHGDCIAQWIRRGVRCPLCRRVDVQALGTEVEGMLEKRTMLADRVCRIRQHMQYMTEKRQEVKEKIGQLTLLMDSAETPGRAREILNAAEENLREARRLEQLSEQFSKALEQETDEDYRIDSRDRKQ